MSCLPGKRIIVSKKLSAEASDREGGQQYRGYHEETSMKGIAFRHLQTLSLKRSETYLLRQRARWGWGEGFTFMPETLSVITATHMLCPTPLSSEQAALGSLTPSSTVVHSEWGTCCSPRTAFHQTHALLSPPAELL
ncbi:uncharacterized protein LOC144382541 isoform X2 [Halichoerus grypus]